MPTRAQIAAAGALQAEDVAWVLPAIKQSKVYTENPGQFPTLEADLTALVGDADKGSQIRAIIAGFEKLGDAQVVLSGGQRAISFDLAENRDILARYVLNVIYDLALLLAPANRGEVNIAIGHIHGPYCGLCGCAPCCCNPYC